MGPYRWSLGGLAVWSMLLAACALNLHGVQLELASVGSTPGMHGTHPDCPGHAAANAHMTADHDHADDARSNPAGTERMPAPSRQLDCCTAVAAAVLPGVDVLVEPVTIARNFALQLASFHEGLLPTVLPEPPRPSYHG